VPSECPGFRRQATALIVREPQTSGAELFSQGAVLFLEIVDDIALLLVHPTGERDENEPQRRRQRGHGAKATRGYSVRQPGPPDFVRTGIQLGVDQVFGHYDIGCYGGLAKLVASWRQPASATCDLLSDTAAVIHSDDSMDRDVPIQPLPVRHISPQIVAALLSQPRALLSERQAETVDVLKQQCLGFTTMRCLVLSFRAILRYGKVTTLRQWMTRAHASEIPALQRFCPEAPPGSPRRRRSRHRTLE
jgi:hypothetical protein